MRPFHLALSILHNRLGTVPRPSWCTYLVTYRCNARCQMCDSWRVKPGDELSAAQAEAVFSKIGRLDVVRLTGGEPFLRQDLGDLAEAVLRAARPSVLHITTNGSFPDRVDAFVEGFSRKHCLRFMVSFDGLREEHDASRGEDVSFDLALETVRRLSVQRERQGVQVSANHTVISPQSMADHAGLRRRLAEFGVDVQSVLAYADSAMYSAKLRGTRAEHLIVPSGYPLHPKLHSADTPRFVKQQFTQLVQCRDPLLRWGKRYYYRGLKARLRGDRHARPRPKCVALRSHIRLLPDGSVPVCQFNTERVGNLLHESFEAVWHGSPASASRSWVDACPGCWAECEVIPSAIYSGDILAG